MFYRVKSVIFVFVYFIANGLIGPFFIAFRFRSTLQKTAKPVLPGHLEEAINSLCRDYRATVLEIVVRGSTSRPVLEVFVDSEDGVSLEDCARLSADIGAFIDSENVFRSAYRLDVSSPGIDRPLQYQWQYKKNVGRLLNISMRDGRTLLGRLQRVDGDSVALQPMKKTSGRHKPKPDAANPEQVLPLADIENAVVELEW